MKKPSDDTNMGTLEIEPTPSGVVMRRTSDLTIHPLAAKMPMLAPDAPERVALRASIELHGLDRQPIIITRGDAIMDGRHRRDDARRVGLEKIPCIVRPEEEAASIIVESLVGRRHYSKGARAYLAAPLFLAAAEVNKDVRTKRLIDGANLRNPIQSGFGRTEEEFAEQLGFSADLARQAKDLHKRFEASDRRIAAWRAKYPDLSKNIESLGPLDEYPVPAGVDPLPVDLRKRYEPQILAGDKGLGAVIQAIGGIENTKGGTRTDRPKVVLLIQGLRMMQMRFGYWGDLTPGEQEEAGKAVSDVFAALPEAVRREIITRESQSR